MLVEVHDHGDYMEAYVPADHANYPNHCREIADADWRYLRRFGRCFGQPAGIGRTRFKQTGYHIPAAAARAVLAAGD